MPYFSDRDRMLIEALRFDPACEPSFELLKSCLVWPDERPNGLSSDGYEKLCDLWIARSFIHRGLSLRSWKIDPDYFERAWKAALDDQVQWPGFRRLELSARDRAYYLRNLAEAADGGAPHR